MTETKTLTLAEFLEARLAEDEAVARDAYYDGQRWVPEEEAVVAADRDLDPLLYLDRKRDAVHAARWSPARVLREVEAKRAILQHHQTETRDDDGDWCGECGNKQPCPEARYLAAIYSDHLDYRDDWRL